jgi:hypothetical protein
MDIDRDKSEWVTLQLGSGPAAEFCFTPTQGAVQMCVDGQSDNCGRQALAFQISSATPIPQHGTDLTAGSGILAGAACCPRLEPICQSWTARERTLMATTRQVRRVHAIERCGACVAPQRAPALSCARTQRLLVNGATQFVFH